MMQFCYGAYNSVVQTLWCASADKTKSISSAYSWFQLNPALSTVEVQFCLQSKSSDMLAVNRSIEEMIHTSGDSGWSLSIFHYKICLLYTSDAADE